MFECLKFIFGLVVDFIKMLFKIDVGFTSLGTVMCITYIFLPMILTIVNFLKVKFIEELDERYDEDRPRNIVTNTFSERIKLGNGKSFVHTDSVRYRRRIR